MPSRSSFLRVRYPGSSYPKPKQKPPPERWSLAYFCASLQRRVMISKKALRCSRADVLTMTPCGPCHRLASSSSWVQTSWGSWREAKTWTFAVWVGASIRFITTLNQKSSYRTLTLIWAGRKCRKFYKSNRKSKIIKSKNYGSILTCAYK